MDFNIFDYSNSYNAGQDIKVELKRNRISASARPVPVTNAGGAMLIIIFVVLCLTVFGFLAFSTAVADRKLTDKNIKNQVAFYAADSNAELKIAEIYETLCSSSTENIETLTGKISVDGDVYYDDGVITVDFVTEQDANHAIYTSADFYVDENGSWDYKINWWYSFFTDELDYAIIYDVWSGE